MPAGVIQPLKTKITAPAQCKQTNNFDYHVNLFSDEFNYGYYEVEIDLKQIDPTIQSISKFQDAYKTIEISNLGNLQIECAVPNIENFIPNRNINLTGGSNGCTDNLGSLDEMILIQTGASQTDNVNFDNTISLYTKNIKVNDTETKYSTGVANGLVGNSYINKYEIQKNNWQYLFGLQITKWFDNLNEKIKETYIQAYYTNDVRLKIRFSKVLFAHLILKNSVINSFGNNKDITIDVDNPNVLGIRNKSDNPVKITFKPR